ncbi:MAG: hypothetical protein RIE56_07965 [Amphiplicatus sp.]
MAERLIDPALPATARKLVFIDLEASGLGSKSWPVEVGWAFEDGAAQSLLIRPHDSWTEEAWDAQAEALHGLTRTRLEEEGVETRAVCVALNEAFDGAKVYSDAPDWDGFWLFRLFSAAGVRQSFSILDYGRLIRPLLDQRQGALLERASRLAPRRHRAADDARHLQVLYRLASEDCAPRLTR